jgi:hypothetical protein
MDSLANMQVHANMTTLVVVVGVGVDNIFSSLMQSIHMLNVILGLNEGAESYETMFVVVKILLLHYHLQTIIVRNFSLYRKEIECSSASEHPILDQYLRLYAEWQWYHCTHTCSLIVSLFLSASGT